MQTASKYNSPDFVCYKNIAFIDMKLIILEGTRGNKKIKLLHKILHFSKFMQVTIKLVLETKSRQFTSPRNSSRSEPSGSYWSLFPGLAWGSPQGVLLSHQWDWLWKFTDCSTRFNLVILSFLACGMFRLQPAVFGSIKCHLFIIPKQHQQQQLRHSLLSANSVNGTVVYWL